MPAGEVLELRPEVRVVAGDAMEKEQRRITGPDIRVCKPHTVAL
jgi:hypothetical protein